MFPRHYRCLSCAITTTVVMTDRQHQAFALALRLCPCGSPMARTGPFATESESRKPER
jgi:hypothetical protein